MKNFNVSVETPQLMLKSAIMVYQENYTSRCSVSINEVAEVNGRPTVKEGRPMTEEDFQVLIHGLRPKDRPSMKWHDEKILASGDGRVLWWSPASVRTMFFRESNVNGVSFTGSGKLAVPPLLCMASDKAMWIYALEKNARPTLDTGLCVAPFFNVFSGGEVCLGNAPAPTGDDAMRTDAWEAFFFGSRFTHPNFTGKDRMIKGIDPIQFWKKQVQKPSKVFPLHRLVKLNMKVSDLMDAGFMSKARGA